jgi:two-component system response regulator (stage 0 sporulation protein F)
VLRQAEASRNQRTVLIVEDDVLQREEMSNVLTREGMQVVSVDNGFAAMHQIRRSRPAVVVLDLKMPGIDGLQVARLIQTLDYEPKVILVSGYAKQISRAHQEDLGVFAIIEKPILFSVLTRFIREAIGDETDDQSAKDSR